MTAGKYNGLFMWMAVIVAEPRSLVSANQGYNAGNTPAYLGASIPAYHQHDPGGSRGNKIKFST